MRKSTLMIKDSCTKTAFSFDGKIYKQIHGVSLGLLLGLILANVIMPEFERLAVDKLIKDDLIRFYIRYVDDNLVLVKVENIDNIMKQFNSFDKSIQITIDRFKDGIVHFLDIKLMVLRLTCIIKSLIRDSIVILQSNTLEVENILDQSITCGATKICSSKKLLNDQNN